MKRTPIIVMLVVTVLFILSTVLKGMSDSGYLQGFLITLSAFLTLAVMSFLYEDNPFYKFAEHLFVGVSAAYGMVVGFWSIIVGNLIPRISVSLSEFFQVPYQEGSYNFFYYLPIIFGLMLLMRLSKNHGWMARIPLAFIIGTTAGLNFIGYLRSDFIKQIAATFIPILGSQGEWTGIGDFFANFSLSASGQFVAILSNITIFLGVSCGLIYFFFSKEHTGWFGKASRLGIWILMITFGASFGYTVMGRISLLVGRMTFLLGDWLGIIS